MKNICATDSDGEFYAIELELFTELARIFGKGMCHTFLNAAMGFTWSHTEGIADRIKAALDAGIPNMRVALPYCMPLAKGNAPRFLDDLAKAAPEARWMHHPTPRAHLVPSGNEYAEYQQTYPDDAQQFRGHCTAVRIGEQFAFLYVRTQSTFRSQGGQDLWHGRLPGVIASN